MNVEQKIPFTISIIISQEPFVSPSAFGCRLKVGGRDTLNEEITCVNTRYKTAWVMPMVQRAERELRHILYKNVPPFFPVRSFSFQYQIKFINVEEDWITLSPCYFYRHDQKISCIRQLQCKEPVDLMEVGVVGFLTKAEEIQLWKS